MVKLTVENLETNIVFTEYWTNRQAKQRIKFLNSKNYYEIKKQEKIKFNLKKYLTN